MYVVWDGNMPVPVYRPPMNNQAIHALNRAGMSFMYEPKMIRDVDGTLIVDPKEEKFVGKTTAEVATIRRNQLAAEGDIDSHKFVLDYTIGKPKQHIEQVTVNMTLADALDKIARDEAVEAEVKDVTPLKLSDV